MSFKAGRVYFFKNCPVSNPVKDKFCICVSDDSNLFYLINSVDERRPYLYEKDHVVYLEKHQVSCLSHKSYINISKIQTISIEAQHTELEILPNNIWLSIKSSVKTNRLLSVKYKSIIEGAKKNN